MKKHWKMPEWTSEELEKWVKERQSGVQYNTEYGAAFCPTRESQWEVEMNNKPTVTCNVNSSLLEVGKPAYVRRTSDHPRLGQPTSKLTETSEVVKIDLTNGTFETINTVYKH